MIGSQSLVYELCLTCRQLPADEALACGLVSRVLPDKEATLQAAVDCAKLIAANSPVASQATKMTLVHARDHSVQEGLEYVVSFTIISCYVEGLRTIDRILFSM